MPSAQYFHIESISPPTVSAAVNGNIFSSAQFLKSQKTLRNIKS
jgi:hypothetical protein